MHLASMGVKNVIQESKSKHELGAARFGLVHLVFLSSIPDGTSKIVRHCSVSTIVSAHQFQW